MAKRPDLVVLTGELKGKHFSVGVGALRLGRSSSCDIHICDEELSRNHCLFEISGETGLRVTDLASANGTMVNGEAIGSFPVELKEGDVVQGGVTTLSVGEPKASENGSIDLGLGTTTEAEKSEEKVPAKKRKPIMNILWIVTILVLVGVTALILLAPPPDEAKPVYHAPEQPMVKEVQFEKVKADSKGIFRYALTAQANGTISVSIDDTQNDRHMLPKTKQLSAEALAELNEILAYKDVMAMDNEYVGIEPDPPALESMVLKVVYSSRVKRIAIINSQEPELFMALREKLESFSKSELGVWAIAYSRERLIELAEDALKLGDQKWEDRNVNHGNLASAIAAYQESQFYLETVNPKPAFMKDVISGLGRAKAELAKRYTDQRFLADKAMNLAQWDVACEELKVLLEMIPDRKDDRHRDARQKLISAENNLKKKGGK